MTMTRTVKAILLTAITLLIVAMLGYFSAAQTTEPSADAKTALKHFLDVDCEVGEEGEALNRLLSFKTDLEPQLIAELRDGPDKQTLDESQRALEEQWNVRQAYLSRKPNLGLNAKQLQVVIGLTREAFITEGREQIILKHRENAAIGLAAIGSPEAIKALRQVSEKGDEALKTVIQAALQKYQKK
jgi:hypothetical protein